MTETIRLFLTSHSLEVEEVARLVEEQGGWCDTTTASEDRRQRSLGVEILAEGGGSVLTGVISLRVLTHVITELLRRRHVHVSMTVDESGISVEWQGDSKSAAEVSAELERIVKAAKSSGDDLFPLGRVQIEEAGENPTHTGNLQAAQRT